jgi:cyclase
MLKCRVIPTLLHKDIGLVKGVRFDSWRRVGAAMQTVKVYNLRDVDELVFFDIAATPNQSRPAFEQIEELAQECFMPMTVGGGVQTVDDMECLLQAGADKVAINTAAVEQPSLLRKGADRFGRQCMVACLDVRRRGEGWEVVTHCGQQATGQSVVECAQSMEAEGAGEIILTSIDQDGTMDGYDLPLIKAVTQVIQIPVIASGGAGNYQHMVEAITESGAAAVAAASMFHFTEQTPKEAKLMLKSQGISVRAGMA